MSAAARVDAPLTPVEAASTPVNVDRAITALAAVLTVLLTAVAFWLSYEHLQEVAAAARHGGGGGPFVGVAGHGGSVHRDR